MGLDIFGSGAIGTVAEETEPRAKSLLSSLMPEFADLGWVAAKAPSRRDNADGSPAWYFKAEKEGFHAIGVVVELSVKDPWATPPDSVGFNLRVMSAGENEPILDWADYNESKQLWVPASDAAAVLSRWVAFESAVRFTGAPWMRDALLNTEMRFAV